MARAFRHLFGALCLVLGLTAQASCPQFGGTSCTGDMGVVYAGCIARGDHLITTAAYNDPSVANLRVVCTVSGDLSGIISGSIEYTVWGSPRSDFFGQSWWVSPCAARQPETDFPPDANPGDGMGYVYCRDGCLYWPHRDIDNGLLS